ncbi:hypothetical protein EJB05_47457, partial [Eragrostis curvula]
MEMITRDARRKRPRSPRASDADQTTAPRPARKRRGGDGIYVPPHRAAADESSDVDALRKSITGLVNKATAANVRHVAPELLAENLVRGRGLLCRALLRSQAACPALTHVFAALAAVVNAKLPVVGRLLLVRLALRIRRARAHGDKPQLASAARFVAHLVNQGVAHELLALELTTLLLHAPTPGSVEVAVGLVRECGAALTESCPRGVDAVFECLRRILRDGVDVDKRVQFMIEDLFAVRRARFRDHPRVRPELDLIDTDDQVTHQVELSLDDDGDSNHVLDPELHLDVFNPSPLFKEDDKAYEEHKRTMFGDDTDEDDDEAESSDEEEAKEPDVTIVNDETQTDLTNLRRTIYLTVMSSLDSEEAGHKLLSVVRPGQEAELCAMTAECCTKEKASCTGYYGRLARRLCATNRAYGAGFAACFARHYAAAHLMQTDELRASSGLFARLLAADGDGAVPWRAALGRVRVTEEDTTSSSRIFLKELFLDLAEQLGIRELSRRMNDEDAEVRNALFPRDSANNTRFAINFFTAIGLGGVTESARQHLLSAQ